MSLDKVSEAEELLIAATKNYPDDPQFTFVLAQVLAYDGRIKEAIHISKTRASDAAEATMKVRFLLLAGDLSLQSAQDGPAVTRRRGAVT